MVNFIRFLLLWSICKWRISGGGFVVDFRDFEDVFIIRSFGKWSFIDGGVMNFYYNVVFGNDIDWVMLLGFV